MLISLEGLPGAGKTTVAELVAKRLGAETLAETTHDHPFIDSVYEDEGRYDLEVELAFLLLHAGASRRAVGGGLVIADFAPAKDVLFARDMLEDTDLDLWMRVYEHVYASLRMPDLVVYLRVDPEECLRRVRLRDRAFEARVTLERLERLEGVYAQHLAELGEKVAVLDLEADRDAEEVATEIVSLLQRETKTFPTLEGWAVLGSNQRP